MMKSSMEVSWTTIWEKWKTLGHYYFDLDAMIKCEKILISKENCPPNTIVQ